MNALESRLIQLNDALLKLAGRGDVPSEELMKQAHHTAAGGEYTPIPSISIDSGPGNDIIIINQGEPNDADCHEHHQEDCPREPINPTHSCDRKTKAVLVSQDYTVCEDDYYIGVNSNNPITIRLPTSARDCFEIIVKIEGPALGQRKITIVAHDDISQHLIDGKLSYVLTDTYQSIRLLCRGGKWLIV